MVHRRNGRIPEVPECHKHADHQVDPGQIAPSDRCRNGGSGFTQQFKKPLLVFSLFPRNTTDLDIFPMAILDTRFFAFMARMAARIAFIARIAFAMIEEDGKT